jgi:hypothetical protein
MSRAVIICVLFLMFSTAFANDPIGTPFPILHNSSDMMCSPGTQCTEEEFQQNVSEIRNKWPGIPEQVRALCAPNQTYPSLYSCLLNASLQWLNSHPGMKADWVP